MSLPQDFGVPPMGTTWAHDGTPMTADDVRRTTKAFSEQTKYVKALEVHAASLTEIAKSLAAKVEKLQAEREAMRDKENSDTTLLNFVQWHLDNHGTDLANKELRKWGGLTKVREELERLRSIYNGGIKIPRNKKGDPI